MRSNAFVTNFAFVSVLLLAAPIGVAAHDGAPDEGDTTLIHACQKVSPSGRVKLKYVNPLGTCASGYVAIHWPLSSPRSKLVAFNRLASEGSGNQVVTGVGFQPTALVVTCGQGGTGHLGASVGLSDEVGAYSRLLFSETDASSVATDAMIAVNYDGNNGMEGEVASYDSDGFTIAWTVGGAGLDIGCSALAMR